MSSALLARGSPAVAGRRASRRPAVPVSAVASADVKTITLKAQRITPEAFAPFGQLIGATEDGKVFDSEDAQLVLDRGTPRFYLMRLPARKPALTFDRITFHAQCTQCLGVLQAHPWYMAVARPSGGVEAYPRVEDLAVFEVPHGVYVKMDCGTWHAGPFFEGVDHLDFYNLELSDTNVTDHNTHKYSAEGVRFQIVPPSA
ncbi:ureidoglycolate hydrolase [Raphidocelis subcapitata]|uniref:Ureidoglycolate hydrolase n=1 Tax=Raphidocelis subcapitata TaxID=307507 RepID=A0A2V0PL87_9CHLO|nr:ureidoglycolate hydrolase [Raphidocelis subcapitata]|eukprot:GBG00477.1 ureidoglycolate hydrolase [Raphidocelis subcapitata]